VLSMNNTVLLLTIGLPAIAALLIGVAVWRSRRAASRGKAPEALEREFRNVFAMTSKDRQEIILKGWMERKGCTRSEAMRLAIDERRHVR
jgi:hypothetical protein